MTLPTFCTHSECLRRRCCRGIKLQSVTAAGAHFGQPGYETDLLYLAGLAALVLGGSGPIALDRLRRRSSSQ